ncbi:hypothetical protein FBY22_8784 [Streptomyces sp. SLBN-31]|nr:hypothetical protein FBY22_8784 [Streptomyces sp. SLBN-31]
MEDDVGRDACSLACSARQARSASKAGWRASGSSAAAALALEPFAEDAEREVTGFFGSLRSGTSRSRRSTDPLASVSTSVP